MTPESISMDFGRWLEGVIPGLDPHRRVERTDFRAGIPQEFASGLFVRVTSIGEQVVEFKAMFGCCATCTQMAAEISSMLRLPVRVTPPHMELAEIDGDPVRIRSQFWVLDFRVPGLLVQRYKDEIVQLNKIIEKEVEWLTGKNAAMAAELRRLRRAL
jgi:hypothetical protein